MSAPAFDRPPDDAVRRAVLAAMCPFCGRGPFQVLAGHTQRTHGVDRFELRELAGLTYSTSILDPVTREEFSTRAKELMAAGILRPPTGGSHARKRLSPEGRRIAREKLQRILDRLGPEGVARQRAAAGKRAAEQSRKPHPCPVCATLLPTAYPITCSPACRRVIRVRTARASAAKRRQRRDQRKAANGAGLVHPIAAPADVVQPAGGT